MCIIRAYQVLLTRLEHTFGMTDKALAWLRSYLSERHQNVVVDSTMSADYVLQCGVPQGPVLGPVLYCMYTRPVCDIVARHGMQYHCYADDIQIYATVGRVQCIAAALLKIEACVVEVADQESTKIKQRLITGHHLPHWEAKSACTCRYICQHSRTEG